MGSESIRIETAWLSGVFIQETDAGVGSREGHWPGRSMPSGRRERDDQPRNKGSGASV
jgi:hypothetical protein